MKKKVFLTRTMHDFALKELKKRYQIEVHAGKIPIPESKLRMKIRDVDGLVCFPYDKITKETMMMAKNLKVISTYSVGYDHIDIEFARQSKIRVGYTPEVLTDATADLAFGLMLDVMRRISEGDRTIREGKWTRIYGAHDYVGVDLQKKTLGILGFGRIGRTLAKRAKAFDMKITYHSRNRIPKQMEAAMGVKYASLDKIITESDIVSVHVPQTEQTDQMFDRKTFKRMKRTSFLINTSRGRIINEEDLILALKSKEIAGVGLDVFDSEPIGGDHPFVKMSNVVLAPHIGSSTKETRERMAEITVKNIKLGINGKKPAFSIGY